ncbi:MAG: hypothetical protein ACYDCK_00190 [Thermoplasmatota archaeon]
MDAVVAGATEQDQVLKNGRTAIGARHDVMARQAAFIDDAAAAETRERAVDQQELAKQDRLRMSHSVA